MYPVSDEYIAAISETDITDYSAQHIRGTIYFPDGTETDITNVIEGSPRTEKRAMENDDTFAFGQMYVGSAEVTVRMSGVSSANFTGAELVLEFGVDIVTHSTTKYMDGHAMAVGGCIVDSGNFDWEAHHDKFKGLTEPDPSYHGLAYTKAFGKGAFITKATAQLMRDLGSIQAPQNAFLLNVGLETLHLRMPRHCENALACAKFLQNHPKVAWVDYAGLEGNKYYELAQKQFKGGLPCGVLTFGIKGGREKSIQFMDNLKMICIVTHVADARSCVLHPASHTHRQLSDEQLT